MKSQGNRIKDLRERNKWTQKELAARVTHLYGKKVTQQSIQQLEIDKVTAPQFWAELCEALGVESAVLRAGTKQIRKGDEKTIADTNGAYHLVQRVLSDLTKSVEKNELTEDDILLLGKVADRMKRKGAS